MILPLLFLQLAIQSQPSVSLTCGDPGVRSSVLRSSAGITAVLKVHSGDDHDKNLHLCEADYTMQVTRSDGTVLPPHDFLSIDEAWGRPILFRIEGFAPDGGSVFVFISDGKHPATIEAGQFDLTYGGRLMDTLLDSNFTSRLSPACAATLHIAGLSPADLMVLASSQTGGCATAQFWEIVPENTSGPALPEYFRTLSSTRGVVALDHGQPVQP